MKIVNVIPIAKDVFQENLSYFTNKNIQPGALVTVPIRGRNTLALVSSAEEIKNIKAVIKTAGFKLRPVKSIKSPSFLRPEFIEACKKTAEYFVSPLGAVIRDFIPQAIVGSGANFNYKEHLATPPKTRRENILIQAQPKDRLQYYKSVIREEFAKNHSVFFCVPTYADIDEFSGELQKGIEKYTIILRNKLPIKKLGESWSKAVGEKHPVLIIATKSFLSLPRKDISALIVERESSPHYKIKKRPYADARKFAELLSEEMKIKLIAGDSVGRVESFFRRELSGDIPPSRVLSEAEQIIVDMKKEQNFSVISAQLKKILEQAYENNEKVILFASRRGHSPITFCNDCARAILCDKCDTPLVLHKDSAKNKKPRFICHKCLTESEAPEKCPYCQSWNLKTLGIGVQKIADEIEKYFPKFKIFKMDSDIIKNAKQGKEMAKLFMSAPGSILIGTEILFSYLPTGQDVRQIAERVAIISMDALFSLPDFRINEKIFRLLLNLRSLAKKTFLAQTRLRQARPEEHDIFSAAARGNISGFYKTEIENRKIFQYPPFKTLIKITREGKNEAQIKKEVQEMEKILEEWEPFSYQAFTPKIKNIYSRHILLKIEPGTWPSEQKKLHQILSSLSPSWKIDVDPESLL
jgi:primosomal protein N' (replication factor Y)